MIGIVCSRLDSASRNMEARIISANDFDAVEGQRYLKYEGEQARIYEIDAFPYLADFADGFGCDALLFLSRHRSAAGRDALTTHSPGNWRSTADIGGKPKQLSSAAPALMLSVLTSLGKIELDVEKTYEATHHGPLLKTPSLFAEVGGSDKMVENKEAASRAGDAVFAAVVSVANGEAEFQKVAVGIGSNHYPEKFSSLALTKGYAFSHIMPKYAILNEDGSNNLDVLAQTMERSAPPPEAAVIDWKSMNAPSREQTIKKLGEIGLDYERV